MPNNPLAFGEENPTAGETAVSWQTWINSSGTVPTILGDADWGSLSLPLSGGEGRSAVYFVTGTSTVFSLAKNVYGTGGTEAILEIRGSTGSFSQSSASPTWEIYTGSITRSWQYVQVRARTGNIYYIDATTGSDSNSGTYSQPWQTIAKVNASTFRPGDRILFKKGETWAGMLTPPSSGLNGIHIVFGAYGSGALPIINGSALAHALYIEGSGDAPAYLTFQNIKFLGSTGTLNEVARIFTHDVLVDSCEFVGSSQHNGLSAWSSATQRVYNITVTNCVAYDNYRQGFYIGSDDKDYATYNCLIENCTAYSNGHDNSADHGIYVKYGVTVKGCTAYNNCAAGIKVNSQGDTGSIYNPIIENCYVYSDGNSPPGTNHQWFGIYCGHDQAIIRNNHVGPGMKSSQIYMDADADNCDIYFNTFCNSISSMCIKVDGNNTGNDIRNNIFCNDTAYSGANTLWDEIAGALSTYVQNNVIDYNVYYYDGNVATKVFGYADYNWAEWKALTGSPDANSTMLTALPGFVARYTDLHAANAGNLLNTGVPITGLDTDKDGGNRSDTTPTAGCYEDSS